jgi:BRCT domain type II-containing protein
MSTSLKGANICFTGALPGFTRAELEAMATEYGFNFHNTVTRATNILVAGEKPGDTKVKKARDLGIKVWTADDFIMMLGADDADGIREASPKVGKKTREEDHERLSYYEDHEEAGLF